MRVGAMAKVSISIVSWNSMESLPKCLDLIYKQTFRDFEVILVDNASVDGVLEFVESYYPYVRVVRNAQNEGFCQAHNRAIHLSDSQFFMPLNPDVFLTSSYVEKLVEALDSHKDVGIVVGKMYVEEGSDILDGAGLVINKARRQYLRGHGQCDTGQFDSPEYVFGACGAAPLYRREMLDDIELEGEYFDELFFAHKEDLDLSWRAQLYGWKCLYVPDAIAYHNRSFSPSKRKQMPKVVRLHAVKNRYLPIIKNDLPSLFFRHLVYILWYDIRILGYLALFERSSFRGIVRVLQLLPQILPRRKIIMQKKRVTDAYMAQWFE
jgi:GT2 family glycosyltransferase